MASEAQRLIGISLTKIAQSRSNRSGVSLHRNLLVATVLQKARYIFMEEAYNMVHYQSSPAAYQPRRDEAAAATATRDDQQLIGATAEEVGIATAGTVEEASSLDFLQTCEKCTENQNNHQNKENQPPLTTSTTTTSATATELTCTTELTYLDLDKAPSPKGNLKRRRAVTDWETEEAVQSILPKKCRSEEDLKAAAAAEDSVFLDDATILSDAVSREIDNGDGEADQQQVAAGGQTSPGAAMEIDRITSLVSIFSFGVADGKLTRSVSTPDLCSAQAKDATDALQQQRPFLAMTV